MSIVNESIDKLTLDMAEDVTVLKDSHVVQGLFTKPYLDSDGYLNYLDREWRYVAMSDQATTNWKKYDRWSEKEKKDLNDEYWNNNPDRLSFCYIIESMPLISTKMCQCVSLKMCHF